MIVITLQTNISFAMHLLLKNDAHYPRSNEFLPERFLRNNEEAVAGGCPNARTAHPFIYLPFGKRDPQSQRTLKRVIPE